MDGAQRDLIVSDGRVCDGIKDQIVLVSQTIISGGRDNGLIAVVGGPRLPVKVVRTLATATAGSVRLTKMSFSVLGSAPTKETLARVARVKAKKRETNIVGADFRRLL